jgi:two-component system, cell cycle response regulator DivK
VAEVYRVLVVDDFEDARILYAEALRENGFTVWTASDGAEAVTKAREHRPDAIVMDLAMPVVDGFSATRTLKSDPTTRGIFILAITGHAERSYVDRAYASHVDAIMLKPCSPLDVVARIRSESRSRIRA